MKTLLTVILAFFLNSACSGPNPGGSGSPTRQAVDGFITVNAYSGQAYPTPKTKVAADFRKLTANSHRKGLPGAVRAFANESGAQSRAVKCQISKGSVRAAAAVENISVGRLSIAMPPSYADVLYIDSLADSTYGRVFSSRFDGGIYHFTAEGSKLAYGFEGSLLVPPVVTEALVGDRSLEKDEQIIQKSAGMSLSWKAIETPASEPKALMSLEVLSETETQATLLSCLVAETELTKVDGKYQWNVEAAQFAELLASPSALVHLTRFQGFTVEDTKLGEVTFVGAQTLAAVAGVAE